MALFSYVITVSRMVQDDYFGVELQHLTNQTLNACIHMPRVRKSGRFSSHILPETPISATQIFPIESNPDN